MTGLRERLNRRGLQLNRRGPGEVLECFTPMSNLWVILVLQCKHASLYIVQKYQVQTSDNKTLVSMVRLSIIPMIFAKEQCCALKNKISRSELFSLSCFWLRKNT